MCFFYLLPKYTFIWSSLIFGTLAYSKRTVEFDESSFKNKPLNVMNTVDLFSVANSDLVISGLEIHANIILMISLCKYILTVFP